MRQVFLDTSGILALVNKADNLHTKAIEINQILLLESTQFITTDYVIVEVGNALSRHKSLAIKTIDFLLNSTDIEIIEIDRTIYDDALAIYKAYADKDWGLTDITSFLVMGNTGISEAFTHDKHFAQYGFVVLR